MKRLTKKKLREHQDPLLLMTRYARHDVAYLNRLVSVHDYKPKPKRKVESGRGREHTVLSAKTCIISRAGEKSGKLSWGFSIEIKKKEDFIVSFLELEIDNGGDLVCLSHDQRKDVWRLRAELGKRPKLAKLLKEHGVKAGDGGIEVGKPDRFLIIARDLIRYFHDHCYERLDDA